MKITLPLALVCLLAACSTQTTPTNNNKSTASAPSQPAPASAPSTPPEKPLSSLQVGEASGTFVVDGRTIPLRYAYAKMGKMFDEDAVVVMVTEKEMSADAILNAVYLPDDNSGLHYKVGKGFWVMYNPGSFQTSGINTFKEYSVENGIVRGHDEDSTNFDGKDYKRSVSFVARIVEKK